MKNFMILIREEVARFHDLPKAEMQAEIAEYTQWVEEMSEKGHYLSGDPLESEGRYITGDSIHADGPFIEAKEAVTGYVLIQAENIEAAVALCQKCPVFKYGGALEVRPVIKY